MKEHPILFNGDMVRAILDGRKTQTRRLVKPQPSANFLKGDVAAITNGERWAFSNTGWGGGVRGVWPADPEPGFQCPYGQPGDRLWVREAHAIVPRTAYEQSAGVDQVLNPDDDHDAAVFRAGWERSKPGPWRPSIHMPRWACRILLEVTAVRVERLKDITDADAKAEGYPASREAVGRSMDPWLWYRSLWKQINGPDSWDANPWVWVIDFRRIDQQPEAA